MPRTPLSKSSASKQARRVGLGPPVAARLDSPRVVGYARVCGDMPSTREQLAALKAAGCERIFADKGTDALRLRPQLDRALAHVRRGDTLIVYRLDRLGRSLRHLLEFAETLRERGVALRSLTEQLDTSTPAGGLLYTVLGAVAGFERDVLRERTVAGMRAAQGRGEHIGRPPALGPAQIRVARAMLARGESASHVAQTLRVGRSTLYRAISKEEIRAGALLPRR